MILSFLFSICFFQPFEGGSRIENDEAHKFTAREGQGEREIATDRNGQTEKEREPRNRKSKRATDRNRQTEKKRKKRVTERER